MTGEVSLKEGGSIQKGGWLPFSLLLLVAFLFLLPYLIVLPSGNAAVLYALFDRHAEADIGPSRESELRNLSENLADYLFFKKDSAQILVQGKPALNDDELTHLHDVRALYALSGQTALFGCVLISGVLIFFFMKTKDVKKGIIRFLKCLQKSGMMLTILFLLTALWALADFTGIFHAFHQISFNNELWLLNPQKDLLIQLMPEPFFTDYLKRFALPWLLAPILFSLPLYRLIERKTER
ncbi:MAG: TIGR01906 family membrane protein [Bacillota bacterium]|nr:TIGR01906 family membrane protein [Bacillota bacterium]